MNNSGPLVSIVTASFNQGAYLEQTIQSVLNQSYPRIEYLVMDGGSTDESPAIIRKYESRLAYWHSRPDGGCSDAIRQGFERSSGEILAYLNSDDVLLEDAVQNAVDALGRCPGAVLVYGNRICIDSAGKLLYYRPNLPWLTRSPFVGMIIGQESSFWRRTAYERVGGIDAAYQFAFDYDLFTRLGRLGAVVHDGRIWACFRKHAISKTMTQYRKIGKPEIRRTQLKVWGRPPNRLAWLTVMAACRFFALCAPLFIRKPKWPRCLPPMEKVGLLKGYRASLHETSRRKRLLGAFVNKRKT